MKFSALITALIIAMMSLPKPAKAQEPPNVRLCTGEEQAVIKQQQYTASWVSKRIVTSLTDKSDSGHKLSMNLSKKWFGTNNTSFILELVSNYELVAQVSEKLSQGLCVSRNDGQFVEFVKKAGILEKVDAAPDIVAYVHPTDFGKEIYYMPKYFELSEQGYDSLAGSIVHEILHFDMTSSLDDIAYGYSGALSLVNKYGVQVAKKNADNYQYFFEEFLRLDTASNTLPNFKSIDKSGDSWPNHEEYWVVFLSRDYVPGHAFIVWGVRDRFSKKWKSTIAYGLYPRKQDFKLAFGGVEGLLVGKSVDNIEKANDGLAVAVSKRMYDYSIKNVDVLSAYPDDYNLYKNNCVHFMDLVSRALSLSVPDVEGLERHPVLFVKELKSINQ